MTTRVVTGLHTKDGPRDGIGEIFKQGVAGVFASGPGGPLDDEFFKRDYAYRIYRNMKQWGNAPHGLEDMDEGQIRAVAQATFPAEEEEYLLNPNAHAYAILNEVGADNPDAIQKYVWFEDEWMNIATPRGWKLALCGLFSGSPDDGKVAGNPPDGQIEWWKKLYGDHLRKGAELGHLYHRHVYGYPWLVNDDGSLDWNNVDRAFREIDWLADNGIKIGVVWSEYGIMGGEDRPDHAKTMQQVAAMEPHLQEYHEYLAFAAWWTWGTWKRSGKDINHQDMSHLFRDYFAQFPTGEKWVPFDPSEPPPEPPPQPPPQQDLITVLGEAGMREHEERGVHFNIKAGLFKEIADDGLHHATNEFPVMHDGQNYMIQIGQNPYNQAIRRTYVYQPGHPIWSFPYPTDQPPIEPPIPPVTDKIDLAPYFFPPEGQQYSRQFMQDNSWGQGSEKMQLQTGEGGVVYQVKNRQYEKRIVGPDVIKLVEDTSPGELDMPGGLKFYTIDYPSGGGWLPRHMAIGDQYTRTEVVNVYTKDRCEHVSGPATIISDILFLQHLDSLKFDPSGVVIEDIIILQWLFQGRVEETYWYASGLGLVMWLKHDGKTSYFGEWAGGNEPNNREVITC